MTEYWVSRKKWTCKYCNITINDDVPSRRQHEEGLRHKGNVERALKSVYRQSHSDRIEKSNAEKEMRRIEAAARAAMEKDGAAYVPTPASSSAAAGPSQTPQEKAADKNKKPPAWKPKGLSAYGNVAPELAREVEEAKKQFEEATARRRQEGTAGEWTTVQQPAMAALPRSAIGPPPPMPESSASAYPASERDEARQFRLEERRAALDMDDEDDDSGAGPSEIRVKKRVKTSTVAEPQRICSGTSTVSEARRTGSGAEHSALQRHFKPEWTPIKIVQDEEDENEASASVATASEAEIGSTAAAIIVAANPEADAPHANRAPGDEAGETEPGATVEISAEPLDASSAPSSVAAAPTAAPSAASPAAGGSSSGGMFKKRKGGAGSRDTKKIFV